MRQDLGTKQIVALNAATLALAKAKGLDEIKCIRDKAEAVRLYVKSAALGLDLQNHAAELKLRAERKAGEALSRLRLQGGDRKSNYQNGSLKLTDLGISHNQSARWQKEALVPEKEFVAYLQRTKRAGQELTTAGLLRISSQLARTGHILSRQTANQAAEAGGSPRDPPFDRVLPQMALREALHELGNHSQQLSRILAPLCTSGIELKPAEKRQVQRLLEEIAHMLMELEKLADDCARHQLPDGNGF